MTEALPYLVSIDDDPQVLRALARDLRSHYRGKYRLISAASGAEALEALRELKSQNEPVALLLSDQRMPELNGVDFLELARPLFPEAKRVLLTAYSDIEAAIKAINSVQLDYYLSKPWDPPEEKLFPVLDELLDDWQAGYVPPYRGLQLIGHAFSPAAHVLKDFLAGNLIPYRWLDYSVSADARQLLAEKSLSSEELPVVVMENGRAVVRPSIPQLANELGMQPATSHEVYDVAIVGGGPAGLAAAVYGASEGLRTVVIERRAPGGQAGASSRIENYLGFPSGLSGSELARRAVSQASRLGAELLTAVQVDYLSTEGQYKILKLDNGAIIRSQTIILTMGVEYRKLEAQGLDNFTGAGVYYGAANTEALACSGQTVYIVGGGNSAGQAAMYLSRFARQVYILIRRDNLRETMSHYLIEQISHMPNIEIKAGFAVASAKGKDRLEAVELLNLSNQDRQWVDAAALFIFIGTRPSSDWLPASILRDEKGYVLTGNALALHPAFSRFWTLTRSPMLLETSLPGTFAAGDLRAGSMNRVAAAVGEGSTAIKLVHEYLALA